MGKRVFYTDKAPKPVASYSHAVKADGFIFVSGQGPVDPETGVIVGNDIRSQTERTLENIKAILEAAGASLDDVVKVSAFLADMKDFKEFNEVYAQYFSGVSVPVRTTVQAGFANKRMLVEIDVVAYVG